MEGGWKTPPLPSATTRQESPVLIGLNQILPDIFSADYPSLHNKNQGLEANGIS